MNKNTQYVGFWMRLIAMMIDSIWMYGIIYTILWYLIGSDIFNPDKSYTLTQLLFEYIIPLMVVILFWNYKAATPGKMLFKMQIVDAETHSKVSVSRYLLRYIAYFISMIPLCLGFFWVGWDKRKQGWHDKIARTVVIKK